MSRYLLDTNHVSSLIDDRGASPVLARVADIGGNRVCTSIVVAAEIRYGVACKASSRLAEAAERVLGLLEVLPFDHLADVAYGTIRADLERHGLTIGANDLLIAAQCLSVGFTLATDNTREFERVAGLRLENWLR